jgi:hypothetical protein
MQNYKKNLCYPTEINGVSVCYERECSCNILKLY